MGKIRIKTIGDESLEEAEKQKKAVKKAEKLSRVKSASEGMVREEAEQNSAFQGETLEPRPEQPDQPEETQTSQPESSEPKSEASGQKPAVAKKPKKQKFIKTRVRSANYKAKAMEIDKNKNYSLTEGLELLRKVKMAKFDETVELHINTTEAGISGQVKLPHGSGKEVRVAIATDEVLAEVEKGKINFDILIATPTQMPKLAKVAKILGPRGLMPNPKNGTISENPEEASKKFLGGQINFKTESKIPVMHLVVGKTSFEDSKLSENIQTIITAVKRDRIRSITLKSTMSPGIRIQV